MTTLLSKHWRDDLVDTSHTGRQERKRTIRNGTAYRIARAGLWMLSNPTLEVDTSPPDDWEGAWDFLDRQVNSELHSFLGDRSDAANRCMFGVRSSERPECWVNFKYLGVNQVEPVRDVGARAMTFVDAWNNHDLRMESHDRKVYKLITCKERTLRRSWRFTFRYAPGMSHAFINDTIRFYDSEGVEVFCTRPPSAVDSSSTGPLGGMSLRMTLIDDGVVTVGQRTLPVGKIEAHADDWASAVFPVYVNNPTVTITGLTDIHDTTLANGAYADNNYGQFTSLDLSNFDYRAKSLIKIQTSALPAGSVSSFSCTLYAWLWSSSPKTVDFYCVEAANTWVQGTKLGSPEVGSCCWNKLTYNTDNWAGSAGLSTSTTDYKTPADGTVTRTGTGSFTVSLLTSRVPAWEQGTTTNNGLLIDGPTADSVSWSLTRSTDHGTAGQRPKFDITYTTGPAFPYSVLMGRRRR